MGRLQEERGTVSLPANCPSQAIVDVSENMRAKIYSLFCKIGFTDLPGLGVEDHVTLTTIEKYLDFKMGEVWTETMKELEVGVVLLLQANCDIHWWWVFGGQRQWWWVFGGQRQRWWVFGGQAAVVGIWWTETAVVGVWWTETEVVGVWWTEIGGGCLVDRDCDGGCLVDRLLWWVFDGKTAVGGVWWTDCGGECLVDRMMVGVWWTDTGSSCLVDRDCGGGHLVDRHWWWVFGGQNLQRNGGGC